MTSPPRTRRPRSVGMTLLEVTIATVVLAVVAYLAIDVSSRGAQFAAVLTHEAHAQARAQLALAGLSRSLRESTADQVCPFRVPAPAGDVIVLETGEQLPADQVFLCYPVARGPDGPFAFHDGAGSVLQEPRWQGVVVIGHHAGALREYVHYDADLPFSGEAPIRISAVSATTITLSCGVTFDRAGAVGANQRSRVLLQDVAQLEAPNYVTGAVLASSQPLQLRLIAVDTVGRAPHASGGYTVSASFQTGVMSRNRN